MNENRYMFPSLGAILGVLFVILKLTGTINWSWFWVTFPFWAGIGVFFAIWILAAICALIAVAIEIVNRK